MWKTFSISILLAFALAAFADTFRDLLIARNNAPTSAITDSPANYPTGMKIWLEAASLITNDAAGLLSGWGDLSGNGNRAIQATGSDQPTVVTNEYGTGNTVRFDGTSDFMTTPLIGLGNTNSIWTMMFVGRLRAGSAGEASLSRGGVNQGALRLGISATNSIGTFNGSDNIEANVGGALSNGCRAIFIRSTNVNYWVQHNSISNSAAQPAVLVLSFNQLGGYPDFATFVPVDISELVVWTNRVLMHTEVFSLYSNYCIPKYGIVLP